MLNSRRIAAIVAQGDAATIGRAARDSREALARGAEVRLFFRDESIPWLCPPELAERLGARLEPAVVAELAALTQAGDVRLYACSSSLYLWGVAASDLAPWVHGARGLVAFLAEDLAQADQVLSY